jgi:hypothetical protein
MAKLYISEYPSAIGYASTKPQILQEPSLVEQTPVVIGAGSLQSAAFGNLTRVVRIHCDATTPCSIAFGANPTATANSKRLAANATEYFAVRPGDMVAVIQNT